MTEMSNQVGFVQENGKIKYLDFEKLKNALKVLEDFLAEIDIIVKGFQGPAYIGRKPFVKSDQVESKKKYDRLSDEDYLFAMRAFYAVWKDLDTENVKAEIESIDEQGRRNCRVEFNGRIAHPPGIMAETVASDFFNQIVSKIKDKR